MTTCVDREAFVDADVLRRMRAEFDEMPGLRLTFEQTARLMGIDKTTCAGALQMLTSCGYLTRHGVMYSRAAQS